MASHSSNDITVDEVIALLAKTSLPTIVVEGIDDMIVYRKFEGALSDLGVSILPIGGRRKVLDTFLRRGEIQQGTPLLFIADKDIWVTVGVPTQFSQDGLLLTIGYSIENDVYVDGALWDLMRDHEIVEFNSDLERFVHWYALALQRHIQDPSLPISLHPNHVLAVGEYEDFVALGPNETYPHDLKARILADYKPLLRGKSLFSLLLRKISYTGRVPRHTSTALLEMVAVRPGPLLQNMLIRIRGFLEA